MTAYALILAAGFSSRMTGRFKPLLPLAFPDGERSALAALCALYASEGVSPLVVGGNRADDTKREAEALGASFALNAHPERGMFSSICTGMAALPKDSGPIFVHPVDIPLVRRMTVRSLLDAAEKNGNSPLIPTFRGVPGHPPLFPASARKAVLAAGDNGCLRNIVESLSPVMVPVADSFILKDMDTPAEYEALNVLALRQPLLSTEEARELLAVRHAQERGVQHSLAVGRVAARFASALNAARLAGGERPLDEGLAEAGGIIHDVCKGESRHEAAAGRLLRGWGMDAMARLVEDHRDMTVPDDVPLSERELVFLADKFVRGHEPVPLEERFRSKMACYPNDPEAVAAIAGRMERAKLMEARLARECGKAPEELAREALDSSC